MFYDLLVQIAAKLRNSKVLSVVELIPITLLVKPA